VRHLLRYQSKGAELFLKVLREATSALAAAGAVASAPSAPSEGTSGIGGPAGPNPLADGGFIKTRIGLPGTRRLEVSFRVCRGFGALLVSAAL